MLQLLEYEFKRNGDMFSVVKIVESEWQLVIVDTSLCRVCILDIS